MAQRYAGQQDRLPARARDSERHRRYVQRPVAGVVDVEVGRAIGVEVTPVNYARAAAIFLTALRKHGWVVVAPNAPHSKLDMHSQCE
jgi:hypothetical protein